VAVKTPSLIITSAMFRKNAKTQAVFVSNFKTLLLVHFLPNVQLITVKTHAFPIFVCRILKICNINYYVSIIN